MSHGSARLTVYGRLLIVQRHQEGWKQAHIAAAMGISRKCVKTWLDRYASEGESGLATRSSRPHSTPTRTSVSLEAQVVSIRRQQRCGREDLVTRPASPRAAYRSIQVFTHLRDTPIAAAM